MMTLKKIRKPKRPFVWYPRMHMRKDDLWEAKHERSQKKLDGKRWYKIPKARRSVP